MNPSSLESASPQELVYRRLRLFFGNAICTLVSKFARIREPIPLELPDRSGFRYAQLASSAMLGDSTNGKTVQRRIDVKV